MEGAYRELFLRIRGSDEPPAWDGRFQAVIYDIPETRRRDRDALQERSIEAGFGMPRPGLLIGFTEPVEWCTPWMDRTELLVEHTTLTCSTAAARRLAARAWDLPASAPTAWQVLNRLDRIRSDCDRRMPGPRQAFTLYYELMADLARLVRDVPSLPPEITPADWPGDSIPPRLSEISRLLGPIGDENAGSTTVVLGLSGHVEPLRPSTSSVRSQLHATGSR
jgi:phenylacetic acid degradation operon negative regulatory protein